MKKIWNKFKRIEYLVVSVSLMITILVGYGLTTTASADTTATASASVTVSAACSLAATNTTPHTAIINPGVYQADIGITTLKATCNDPDGFAIYAIGYTDTTYGKTTLTANVGGQLSPSNDITTGTATSGTTSKWAMKLNATSPATYPITLDNGYGSYSVVPTDYTKVAHRNSATDAGTSATGSELTTTYAAYIASNQAAGTYNGKVKYTLVHPAEHVAPVPVSKNLYYAITGESNNYTLTISDSDITSGAVAGGPVAIDGYTFNSTNGASTAPWNRYTYQITSVVIDGTVVPTSTQAWFAGFENTESWDLAGLRTDHVTDMSYMFISAGLEAASFNMDLSSWNTSNVTNMRYLFGGAGNNYATDWSVGDLSSWDTSSVTDMSGMFGTGSEATTWSVGDLSSWDTSNVTNMSYMFSGAGYNATNFSLNLSSWDTSNVTNMAHMFEDAGYSATTFSLNLSSWNTSSVTNMSGMFGGAGYSATSWSVTIPRTNGASPNPISNTTTNLYGQTISVTAAPPRSGKSFTLAQP